MAKQCANGIGVGREADLGWLRENLENGGMARLVIARRNDRARAVPATLYGRRRRQPTRRPCALSRKVAVSHSRHEPTIDHWHVRVVRLHPANQCRHRGSIQPCSGGFSCGRALGNSATSGRHKRAITASVAQHHRFPISLTSNPTAHAGCRRVFRVKKCRTSSPHVKLIGDPVTQLRFYELAIDSRFPFSRKIRGSSTFDFCNTICHQRHRTIHSITSSARASTDGGTVRPNPRDAGNARHPGWVALLPRSKSLARTYERPALRKPFAAFAADLNVA